MPENFIPTTRERVRVDGRTGVFFVLSVDQYEKFACVVRLDDEPEQSPTLLYVPLAKLGRLDNGKSSDSPPRF